MNERTRTIALLAHRCCYVATCSYRRANREMTILQTLYWPYILQFHLCLHMSKHIFAPFPVFLLKTFAQYCISYPVLFGGVKLVVSSSPLHDYILIYCLIRIFLILPICPAHWTPASAVPSDSLYDVTMELFLLESHQA